jgi:hypothetical protein
MKAMKACKQKKLMALKGKKSERLILTNGARGWMAMTKLADLLPLKTFWH